MNKSLSFCEIEASRVKKKATLVEEALLRQLSFLDMVGTKFFKRNNRDVYYRRTLPLPLTCVTRVEKVIFVVSFQSACFVAEKKRKQIA